MGSSLVGIDVDAHRGGEETLEAVIDGRPLPRTPIVATGGGGLHLLFSGTTEREGRDALGGPGVDVKASGGYLIAPPSRHHSGERYRWLVWDEEPPTLPYYLRPLPRVPRLATAARALPQSTGTARVTPYAVAALRGEVDDARRRRDGQGRRDGLFCAGLKLSRFVPVSFARATSSRRSRQPESSPGSPMT
jgi:hypothetical protein